MKRFIILLIASVLTYQLAFAQTGDCSDYIDLSGQPLPIAVTGTTAGATNDYGSFPSQPPCWQGFKYPGACGGPDRTYKWTVPADGYYTISLSGSSYDTGLLLFNFTCPTEPSYPEDFVCGNDDAWHVYQSELFRLGSIAGQELLIVVDGYESSAGTFLLRISQCQPIIDPDPYIDSTMVAEHIPGLSACAIHDGDIIWTGNFGHANIAQDIEPTDTTLFYWRQSPRRSSLSR